MHGTASSGILTSHWIAIPRPAILPRRFCILHYHVLATSLGHIPPSALSTRPRPSPKGKATWLSRLHRRSGGALDNTSRCDPQALSETASSGLARSSLEPDADSVRRSLAWATHCETSVDSAPTLLPAAVDRDTYLVRLHYMSGLKAIF